MGSNSWYRLHVSASAWSGAGTRTPAVPGTAVVQKRLLDMAIAAVGLFLLSPMFVLLAVAVKLDSRGPVLFRSRRIGRNGRVFDCLKFRTMTQDSRVTRFGSLLRRFGLDELPQLFTVLTGEMSVVGPRPVLASEAAELNVRHLTRFTMKPGITGLWQVQEDHFPVFGGYISADEFYRDNWSLGLDMRIMLRSLEAAIQGRGC